MGVRWEEVLCRKKECVGCVFVFFFSSRRRHTRLVSDWSSDVCSSDLITLNEGRAALVLTVANTGDRPVQVGSHYHFAETDRKSVV